jgi:hypothetical protein
LWRGLVLVALAWPLRVSDQQRGRISVTPAMAKMVRLRIVRGPPLGCLEVWTPSWSWHSQVHPTVAARLRHYLARESIVSKSSGDVMDYFPFLSIGPRRQVNSWLMVGSTELSLIL